MPAAERETDDGDDEEFKHLAPPQGRVRRASASPKASPKASPIGSGKARGVPDDGFGVDWSDEERKIIH